MTRALLEQYLKRERDNLAKIEEIAQKAIDGGELTEAHQDEMKKRGAERRQLRAVIEELEPVVRELEERNKTVTTPTALPAPSEQERDEQERGTSSGGRKPLFRNIGEQLQAVRAAARGQIDPRLNEVHERAAATGMTANIDADGGFMIEPEVAAGLIEGIRRESVLLNRVQRRAVKSDSLKFYGIDETSRAKGQLSGGISIYPADEADAYIKSAPKFKKVTLELKKVTGLCYVTDEELADIPALESRINTEFQYAFATEIDGWLYNGDGVTVSEGMLRTPSMVTQAIEGGQLLSTGALKIENLAKMRSRLLPGMRKDALWLINQELEPWLFTMMVGTFPAFMPIGGFAGSPEDRLLNIPMEVFEHCEAPGTVGDIMLCVPKRYVMIDKGGLEAAVSIHVRFLYDEQVFKFTYRFDGKIPDSVPVAPRKGSLSLSSVVTLATRSG